MLLENIIEAFATLLERQISELDLDSKNISRKLSNQNSSIPK
jgi:hypothetical protein